MSIIFFSLLLFVATTIATPIPSLPSTPLDLPPSSISAAPSYLPGNPKYPVDPPAFTPDITPLFPSPGRGIGVAPGGSMPTIPSSPSPPNPDLIGPDSAFAPLGSSAASTANASPAIGCSLGWFGWFLVMVVLSCGSCDL